MASARAAVTPRSAARLSVLYAKSIAVRERHDFQRLPLDALGSRLSSSATTKMACAKCVAGLQFSNYSVRRSNLRDTLTSRGAIFSLHRAFCSHWRHHGEMDT